ncbi:AMP-binding domain-containing protein [Pycnococcus provasolii]
MSPAPAARSFAAHLCKRASSSVSRHALALSCPSQSVHFDCGELDVRIRRLAFSLSSLGIQPFTLVASALPNTSESIILAYALQHIGAVLTSMPADVNARDKIINKAGGNMPFVATFASSATGRPECLNHLDIPHVYLNNDEESKEENDASGIVDMAQLLSVTNLRKDDPNATQQLMGVFGSAAVTHEQAMRLAQEAAQKLETKPNDKVCCSVTLLHAFGAASAVGSAVVGDAAVILPEVGGIRGCGSPSQRAQVTADVIATEGVTQLFGDTHTLRALQDVEAPASHHLRTGVIKIGSGSDFLDDVRETPGDDAIPLSWAGTSFHAMGKRSA